MRSEALSWFTVQVDRALLVSCDSFASAYQAAFLRSASCCIILSSLKKNSLGFLAIRSTSLCQPTTEPSTTIGSHSDPVPPNMQSSVDAPTCRARRELTDGNISLAASTRRRITARFNASMRYTGLTLRGTHATL